MSADPNTPKKSPIAEIVQPFIDLMKAPRALWGINLSYMLEGMVYFGMLGYLAIHFSDFVFQGVEHADEWSHSMVMVLTAGITISMFFLGFVADKWGVRRALLLAFVLLLGGRAVMAAAPTVLGFDPSRPEVRVGDTVTLKVKAVGERVGNAAVMNAKLLARKAAQGAEVEAYALDLSVKGLVPSEALESRLVRVSSATVEKGQGREWTIRYAGKGGQPLAATLLVGAGMAKTLCAGATFELSRAYVYQRGKKKGYALRSHWNGDFAKLDTSPCAKKPKRETPGDDKQATYLGAPASVSGLAQGTIDIAKLRSMKKGEVDAVLAGVRVTYVRNGGYMVQASADGPAIFVFVDPMWTNLHLFTLLGMVLVLIGYGMYQPAAYAGVRKFTSPKTAAMGFAMLYALMNLGGWLPSFAFLLRDKEFAGLGIVGTFWVYTGFTVLALLLTFFVLSRRTVDAALERVGREKAELEAEEARKQEAAGEGDDSTDTKEAEVAGRRYVPVHMWLVVGLCLLAVYLKVDAPLSYYVIAGVAAGWVLVALIPQTARWLARHPLADAKFFFFIFALIPVQTLFTYNWLVLPQYIKRAFEGWIGEYFELAANANPLLIFVLVPMIAALTQKAKVYNMMIIGTFIMAAPAFLLAIGPNPWLLFAYILVMTIGEAMWQPRFLQYAAEIAPEGRTGEYMGVAQLPWFLTKVLVPLLYSGWMMNRYCPAEGVRDTETMWLIFGFIAISSPVLLVVAKGWVGKDFKTRT